MAEGEHGRATSEHGEHRGSMREHERAAKEHGGAEGEYGRAIKEHKGVWKEHIEETGVSGGAKRRGLYQWPVTCWPQIGDIIYIYQCINLRFPGQVSLPVSRAKGQPLPSLSSVLAACLHSQ